MYNASRKFYSGCPEKGMALVLVLVFTAVLMVCGTALMTYAVNEKLIANYQGQDMVKFYLAESGVEVGLAALQENFYFDSEIRGTLPAGSFRVTFEDVTETERRIISEGLIEDYSLVLNVTVHNDPEKGIVLSGWHSQ